MRVDAFDFHLPDALIALRPAEPRDSARLLALSPSCSLTHRRISDLPSLLAAGDVLVLNDTKVIHARLRAERASRNPSHPAARVEIMLHKRVGPDQFGAFARPARKLVAGDTLAFGPGLTGTVMACGDRGEVEVRFSQAGTALDAAIDALGEVPLPPYIAGKRVADARDAKDYQTVFAQEKGSVAAPTAGLHFTPSLLAGLAQAGIDIAHLTLHVGAGTFLPVTAVDTGGHRMHAERAVLTAETAQQLNAARAAGGRIVCVGTTSLRTLETAADSDGVLRPYDGETDIFITPGYRFRVADGLLTNFHLPRSTLFMLVSAFCGLEAMQRAYAEAIVRGYRFYSYGDACLLWRGA